MFNLPLAWSRIYFWSRFRPWPDLPWRSCRSQRRRNAIDLQRAYCQCGHLQLSATRHGGMGSSVEHTCASTCTRARTCLRQRLDRPPANQSTAVPLAGRPACPPTPACPRPTTPDQPTHRPTDPPTNPPTDPPTDRPSDPPTHRPTPTHQATTSENLWIWWSPRSAAVRRTDASSLPVREARD